MAEGAHQTRDVKLPSHLIALLVPSFGLLLGCSHESEPAFDTTMRDRAAKFNAEKVKQEDLSRMGGGVPDDEG
jgi:hypothetical protein